MDFKVYIDLERHTDILRIYIYNELPNNQREICTDFNTLTFERIDAGTLLEPTLKFPRVVTKPLLQALANEMHRNGIVAEGEPVLRNELDSVKYHLEDMRRLVFKK